MLEFRIAAAAWLEERNAIHLLASCTDLTLDDRRRELLDQLNVARERTHEIDSKQAHKTIQAKVRSGSDPFIAEFVWTSAVQAFWIPAAAEKVGCQFLSLGTGGEGGIRTRDTVSRIHAFQASALSHSATSPAETF